MRIEGDFNPKIDTARLIADASAEAERYCKHVRDKWDGYTLKSFNATAEHLFKMGVTVAHTNGKLRIVVAVSPRARFSVDAFSLKPSNDTTGRNRASVTGEILRGNAVEIPNGFIWKGKAYRRIADGHITQAGRYLFTNTRRTFGEIATKMRTDIERHMVQYIALLGKSGKEDLTTFDNGRASDGVVINKLGTIG